MTSLYYVFLIWFCPILNLLCGVSIDLYAPALVEISHDLHTNIALSQNTITATIIGFACGQILWGAISPRLGIRNSLFYSLLLYCLFSILAIFVHEINTLILYRFLQGFAAGSFAVNSRALLGKNFHGKQLTIAILYLSIAWGIGPIIAPYLGSILTVVWNWQTNFIALFAYGIILILANFFIEQEESATRHKPNLKQIVNTYFIIMTDPKFLLSTMMLGIVMLSNIMFGLIGAPMVKHVLGLGPHTVGTLSLMIGGGYLLGNLTNRIFVSKKDPLNLVLLGIIMYGLSLLPMLIFAHLNLFILAVAMIFFISYSTGFIFPNILARCLTLHKENISFAAAAQGAMMLAFVSIGSYLVSLFTVETPEAMWGAFFTLFMLISIIFTIFKKITNAE